MLTLLSSAPDEVRFVLQQHLQALLRLSPGRSVFESDFRLFFVAEDDVAYVADLKIGLLSQLCTRANAGNICVELREYVEGADVRLSTRAVRALADIVQLPELNNQKNANALYNAIGSGPNGPNGTGADSAASIVRELALVLLEFVQSDLLHVRCEAVKAVARVFRGAPESRPVLLPALATTLQTALLDPGFISDGSRDAYASDEQTGGSGMDKKTGGGGGGSGSGAGKQSKDLKDFTDPYTQGAVAAAADARAAATWLLGEVGTQVQEAPYILDKLVAEGGYKCEGSAAVRLQLLSTAVRMFLQRPAEMRRVLGRLFSEALADFSSQDVHDRAVFLYRSLQMLPTHEGAFKAVFDAMVSASSTPPPSAHGNGFASTQAGIDADLAILAGIESLSAHDASSPPPTTVPPSSAPTTPSSATATATANSSSSSGGRPAGSLLEFNALDVAFSKPFRSVLAEEYRESTTVQCPDALPATRTAPHTANAANAGNTGVSTDLLGGVGDVRVPASSSTNSTSTITMPTTPSPAQSPLSQQYAERLDPDSFRSHWARLPELFSGPLCHLANPSVDTSVDSVITRLSSSGFHVVASGSTPTGGFKVFCSRNSSGSGSSSSSGSESLNSQSAGPFLSLFQLEARGNALSAVAKTTTMPAAATATRASLAEITALFAAPGPGQPGTEAGSFVMA
jgi:hypothetical protein